MNEGIKGFERRTMAGEGLGWETNWEEDGNVMGERKRRGGHAHEDRISSNRSELSNTPILADGHMMEKVWNTTIPLKEQRKWLLYQNSAGKSPSVDCTP